MQIKKADGTHPNKTLEVIEESEHFYIAKRPWSDENMALPKSDWVVAEDARWEDATSEIGEGDIGFHHMYMNDGSIGSYRFKWEKMMTFEGEERIVIRVEKRVS